jgi:hypothetical protein
MGAVSLQPYLLKGILLFLTYINPKAFECIFIRTFAWLYIATLGIFYKYTHKKIIEYKNTTNSF